MAKKRRLVILNGSPRKRGNTAVLLGWFEKACEKQGLSVERVDLYGLRFKGCSHCDACKRSPKKIGCALDDDLQGVLEAVLRADVCVLASPVYCWAVASALKAALDRFYAFFKDEGSLLRGKRMAAIFTAAGDEFDGMDLCVEMTRRLCDYAQAEYVATLPGSDCGEPREVMARKDLKAGAENLAQVLGR